MFIEKCTQAAFLKTWWGSLKKQPVFAPYVHASAFIAFTHTVQFLNLQQAILPLIKTGKVFSSAVTESLCDDVSLVIYMAYSNLVSLSQFLAAQDDWNN